MTVGELVAWLTAEATMLPGGLDSEVVAGVDDDVEGVAGVYTQVEVTPFELGRGRGEALWVRGVARMPVEP